MAKYLIILTIIILLIKISDLYEIHENLFNKNILKSGNYNGLLNRPEGPKEEQDASFWINKSQTKIKELLRKKHLPIRAKNIILFLGDGMSIPTATAARIAKGQKQGKFGESDSLSFENFPYSGISKTYCVDAQVPDSACTATAYLTGVKTNFFALGVTANTNIKNCSSAMDPANHVESIISWAQKAGKATGLVTTTTVTHATPAGAYAHTTNRLYESDYDFRRYGINDSKYCQDIASQLINNSPGRDIDVIMGGGRLKLLPNTKVDPETGDIGQRLDGIDLIEKWKKNNPNGAFVTNKMDLLNLDIKKTSKILGLFNPLNLDFNLDRDNKTQPSLEEMTESAINLLSKDPQGFVLLVEGGLIDYGHHLTMARISIDETLEFDKAVKKARDITNPYNTLIIATADHSHTMSISGYPNRNNDIFGINDIDVGDDNIPYLTLNYANGPKQYINANGKRIDITEESKNQNFLYPGYIPLAAETHGGDDVAVYADGPYAHFFTGVYEQNDIPHKLAFAACIGNGITHCRRFPLK